MAETDYLKLYKKDPITDRNDTFNITTMLNDNWDKINAESKRVNELTLNLANDKVDKEIGKGLSTNDFTTPLKNKLDGIEAGANKYTHPLRHPPAIIETDLNNRFISDLELAQIEDNKLDIAKNKEDFSTHLADKVHQKEVHGIRVNDKNELEYFNGEAWVGSYFRKKDDLTNSPGSKFLIAGTMDAGYFGVVSPSDLFNGAEIASVCGITEGVTQFSDFGWLKFAIDGKIIFKSQKPYRHSISWSHINSKGCVYGSKQIVKNGMTFMVRLMKGSANDPLATIGAGQYGTKYSEWNRLMLPIHIRARDKTWLSSHLVESDVPYWLIDYTDEDLHTHQTFGSGVAHLCQEIYSGEPKRVARGSIGVSSFIGVDATQVTQQMAWSPVLEVTI